mgnify:CR=1 FL=1
MFNLFRKKRKKKIKKWEYKLLKAIVHKLPLEYSFLIEQVDEKYIIDSVPNPLLEEGWKHLVFSKKYSELTKRKNLNYELYGIIYFDIDNENYNEVILNISEGVLNGYKLNKEECHFDEESIDVKQLSKRYFKNEEKQELINLLGSKKNEVFNELEIEDTFKIEIQGDVYYVIKNLGDGNYISINKKGAIFGMIHDPFEIEKVFNNKEDFFEALKSGKFIISEYYDKKMF